MTKMMLDNYSEKYDIDVVFANTGQEHPKTLEFIHNCDIYWGFNTTWIEAVVNPKRGVGIRHRIVDFKTASRGGKPFEDVVRKYGVSNQSRPLCSDRLKASSMKDYRRSIGWSKETVAIGIRVDEKRRVNKKAVEYNIIYPLVDLFPTTKQEILDWFDEQIFNLEIPEHLGNCTWCWKKSLSKHIRLVNECPEVYDFPKRMEEQYGTVGTKEGTGYARHVFFRGNRSVQDIFKIAKDKQAADDAIIEIISEDATNECGESCEMLPMEMV